LAAIQSEGPFGAFGDFTNSPNSPLQIEERDPYGEEKPAQFRQEYRAGAVSEQSNQRQDVTQTKNIRIKKRVNPIKVGERKQVSKFEQEYRIQEPIVLVEENSQFGQRFKDVTSLVQEIQDVEPQTEHEIKSFGNLQENPISSFNDINNLPVPTIDPITPIAVYQENASPPQTTEKKEDKVINWKNCDDLNSCLSSLEYVVEDSLKTKVNAPKVSESQGEIEHDNKLDHSTESQAYEPIPPLETAGDTTTDANHEYSNPIYSIESKSVDSIHLPELVVTSESLSDDFTESFSDDFTVSTAEQVKESQPFKRLVVYPKNTIQGKAPTQEFVELSSEDNTIPSSPTLEETSDNQSLIQEVYGQLTQLSSTDKSSKPPQETLSILSSTEEISPLSINTEDLTTVQPEEIQPIVTQPLLSQSQQNEASLYQPQENLVTSTLSYRNPEEVNTSSLIHINPISNNPKEILPNFGDSKEIQPTNAQYQPISSQYFEDQPFLSNFSEHPPSLSQSLDNTPVFSSLQESDYKETQHTFGQSHEIKSLFHQTQGSESTTSQSQINRQSLSQSQDALPSIDSLNENLPVTDKVYLPNQTQNELPTNQPLVNQPTVNNPTETTASVQPPHYSQVTTFQPNDSVVTKDITVQDLESDEDMEGSEDRLYNVLFRSDVSQNIDPRIPKNFAAQNKELNTNQLYPVSYGQLKEKTNAPSGYTQTAYFPGNNEEYPEEYYPVVLGRTIHFQPESPLPPPISGAYQPQIRYHSGIAQNIQLGGRPQTNPYAQAAARTSFGPRGSRPVSGPGNGRSVVRLVNQGNQYVPKRVPLIHSRYY